MESQPSPTTCQAELRRLSLQHELRALSAQLVDQAAYLWIRRHMGRFPESAGLRLDAVEQALVV
jgi:hypothetical protein